MVAITARLSSRPPAARLPRSQWPALSRLRAAAAPRGAAVFLLTFAAQLPALATVSIEVPPEHGAGLRSAAITAAAALTGLRALRLACDPQQEAQDLNPLSRLVSAAV